MSQDILLFVDNVTSDLTLEERLVKNVRDSFVDTAFLRFRECFMLVDVYANATLRPLMRVLETNASAFESETVKGNFEEWWLTHKQLDECDAFCKFSSDNLFR